MGRNIKHYNGYFENSNSSTFLNTSTGYSVPSGKVARIGFSFSAFGGSNNSRSMAGFYAGGSAASANNRFLLIYYPTTTSTTVQSYDSHLFYNANSGHYWHHPKRDYNPKLFIMDGHICERYTTRNSDWDNYNLDFANSPGYYGVLRTRESQSTTFSQQSHPVFPNKGSPDTGYRQAGLTYGEVHAFAGETIYLFDHCYSTATASYRAFQRCAWNMFIIEEDA